MSFLSNDNGEVLVAGHQTSMFRIDVEQGCIIEEVTLSCCVGKPMVG